MAEVAVANHTWFFKTYRRSFTGDDLIRAIVRLRIAPDTKAALMVGNALMRHHVFHAVWGGDVEVMSTALLYRFSFHEELLGELLPRRVERMAAPLEFDLPIYVFETLIMEWCCTVSAGIS